MKSLFVLFISCIFCISALDAQTYEEEINRWRKTRLERLTAEDGWVTLAGLFWLADGENSFGRSPKNNLVANYPDFPEKAGIFIVKGAEVKFKVHQGIVITCENHPISEIKLTSDLEGTPTVLQYGTFSWYLIRRGERIGIRMKWSEHPNRKKLIGIPSYPVSDEWRVKGRFTPYETPKKLMIPTVIGIDSAEECPGEIHLSVKGHEIVLYPTGNRESMALMFGDAGNGGDTYAGGRFLPLESPDKEGNIIIDFNRAYNPPCVFTPYATCPIPIEENILPFPVEAGEKTVELFPH